VVAGFAVVLWAQGDGWEIADSQLLGLFFTVVWVVGMVNALNLIDLMDGVASSVALAVAGGISALALVWTDVLLAALAVATCGACIGFLRYNLSRPSRIFLGDGGSMPLGFLFAAMIMVIPWPEEVGASRLFAAALLFGLPIFDMTFRIYSRKRRGDTLMTAGPDSIANWLGRRLPSALAVAITLGLAQSLLSCVAIISAQGGGGTLTIVALGTFVLAAGLIWSLDASGFGRHLNPQDKQHVGRRKASEAVAGAPPD
jgi:UDP-GlcNAc:undecaprenyl-phosphate GlcNAc-1-phosphate transferase